MSPYPTKLCHRKLKPLLRKTKCYWKKLYQRGDNLLLTKHWALQTRARTRVQIVHRSVAKLSLYFVGAKGGGGADFRIGGGGARGRQGNDFSPSYFFSTIKSQMGGQCGEPWCE